MENMFSDHNGIKLEINNRNISGKSPKYLEIKLHTLKITHGLKKKSEGKTENILNWMKMKSQHIKICEMQLKQCLREIYSFKCLC